MAKKLKSIKTKKSQIVDTRTSKQDKDLKSLHTKKDIFKTQTKKVVKKLSKQEFTPENNTIEFDNSKSKKSRREKRLQELNDKYQMKAVN